MYHSVGSPIVQLNSSKGLSARCRTDRSGTSASEYAPARIPRMVFSIEDLPIALRIAAVAGSSASDDVSETGFQSEVAQKEKELIGGLVRVLSRGQRSSAPLV